LEKPVDRVEVELIYSSLKKHPMNNLGQSLYNRDKKTYGIPHPISCSNDYAPG
jgi:hypothetical protein